MGRKRTGDTNTTPGKDKKRMRRPKAYDSPLKPAGAGEPLKEKRKDDTGYEVQS